LGHVPYISVVDLFSLEEVNQYSSGVLSQRGFVWPRNLSAKLRIFTLESGDPFLEILDLLDCALVLLVRKRDSLFQHR